MSFIDHTISEVQAIYDRLHTYSKDMRKSVEDRRDCEQRMRDVESVLQSLLRVRTRAHPTIPDVQDFATMRDSKNLEEWSPPVPSEVYNNILDLITPAMGFSSEQTCSVPVPTHAATPSQDIEEVSYTCYARVAPLKSSVYPFVIYAQNGNAARNGQDFSVYACASDIPTRLDRLVTTPPEAPSKHSATSWQDVEPQYDLPVELQERCATCKDAFPFGPMPPNRPDGRRDCGQCKTLKGVLL